MPAGSLAQLDGQQGKPGAVGGLGSLLQRGVHWLQRRAMGLGDLRESCGGRCEQLASIRRIQDVDGLLNPRQLLITIAGALGPLISLVLARGRGVSKEPLGSLQLLQLTLAVLRVHPQSVLSCRLLLLLATPGHHPVLVLGGLSFHQVLVLMLARSFLCIHGLQIDHESIIHVLQDPLNRSRLRRIPQLGHLLEQSAAGLGLGGNALHRRRNLQQSCTPSSGP
mmetsp:Transcript_51114/g.116393  ORF Transcript_51114/g.116393 Transcript_51114/m.116393 type:complete len:223 (+) Transcript_51114:959-1627(+)